MPDVTLDLSTIVNGQNADANAVKAAFLALQNGVNNIDGDNLTDGTAEVLGVSSSSGVRRGKSIIAGAESRTGTVTSYGLMPTPDRVEDVVLPADGLIAIAFSALWQFTNPNAANAAIFIGGAQLALPQTGGAPVAQEVFGITTANKWTPLAAHGGGLSSVGASATDSSGVTTGQVVGLRNQGGNDVGGVVYVQAAAGTYDVSVRFKASSGNVSVKDRKLWVWTLGF